MRNRINKMDMEELARAIGTGMAAWSRHSATLGDRNFVIKFYTKKFQRDAARVLFWTSQ